MASNSFSSLPLGEATLANLDSLDYKEMTPIQAESLPSLLAGKDLIAQAKTGSGKTAAFGLGLLHHLDHDHYAEHTAIQSIVLCPTRELANQVAKDLRMLARSIPNIKILTLCGGKPKKPQSNSLAHGAHIVVGTPGRVQDHLTQSTVDLRQVKTLVLDEADRMLDMGFLDIIKSIVSQTPRTRRSWLFSATYPDRIQKLCKSILRDPVSISTDTELDDGVIQQIFFKTEASQRLAHLLRIFRHYQPKSAVVFCHTKIQCDEVAEYLLSKRVEALAIHGDLEQREREQTLLQFANHSTPVIVATDVAARGLDIKSLPMVINYELPRDADTYRHRIGRTGRAGETGIALSMLTDAEQPRAFEIEKNQNTPIVYGEIKQLDENNAFTLHATMRTMQIDAGRKSKIRAGDILGALTRDAGLAGACIGKIDILELTSYVAIERSVIRDALDFLANGKLKGRKVRARQLR